MDNKTLAPCEPARIIPESHGPQTRLYGVDPHGHAFWWEREDTASGPIYRIGRQDPAGVSFAVVSRDEAREALSWAGGSIVLGVGVVRGQTVDVILSALDRPAVRVRSTGRTLDTAIDNEARS